MRCAAQRDTSSSVHNLVTHAITVFMGFFAIMNPIANAPIFVGLTGHLPRASSKRIALNATLIAFCIVASFCLAGHLVFSMFGIGISAFRVAGGVLVFMVGRHLLDGKSTSPVHTPRKLAQQGDSTEEKSAEDGASPQSMPAADETERALAISPLAVPILAGPGTIACAVNFSSGRPMSEVIISIAVFAVLCVITYAVLVGGESILKRLGPYTMGVIGRLMGLILAVIGVQMMFDGLSGQFPGLFR